MASLRSLHSQELEACHKLNRYHDTIVRKHTVCTGNGPCCADGADRLRVRAVRELEPVVSVRFQVRCLDLEREVHIVACECSPGVDRTTRELGIVEDFEGDADGNARVGESGSDWRGSGT